MRDFASLDDLKAAVGQEVALSDWVAIARERIALFADATDDHQWIHVDTERCRRESPWGAPVAHGFLTLSMIPAMFEQAVGLGNASMVVNYGLNRVRFPAPVPEGSRIRARVTLLRVTELDDCAQLEWSVVVECDGQQKPACVADLLLRRYP
ncbi:MaoC family dehydratase [Massilia sp. PAMC28688]|uniref:MaoC family dehydratase n=1 Tax=Massilia sp. PAMC28688 TaxID=2861283 RepID=UPI001C6324DF|nr:MaoC family dehydratase [Massilia sp. PAMC28688]QYF93329.1 MaoC family dehydratase [Massilia sp. PAMC28688]